MYEIIYNLLATISFQSKDMTLLKERISSLKENKFIFFPTYCKTLTICGIKILRFIENDILTKNNFGIHDKENLM